MISHFNWPQKLMFDTLHRQIQALSKPGTALEGFLARAVSGPKLRGGRAAVGR